MRKQTWIILSLVATSAILLVSGCAMFSKPVTTRSLLSEMTDLAGMAEYPSPSFTCRQFSSYDRDAKSPSENWFANSDRGHYLRVEDNNGRQEWVLMDADGPGAVVRIWSANPDGTLRFYLDGKSEPALEAQMQDLLGGKLTGIPQPLAGVRGRGWNVYFPFPYARHCKITTDKGGFYYHVNYRTYQKGTPVVSFNMKQLETLSEQIQAVANRMASPRGEPAGEEKAIFIVKNLPAGKAETVTEYSGSSAICGLRVGVVADDPIAALRQTILSITFDGEKTVETPLGDFFGTGPGLNAYESLALGVTGTGEMWSHWYMPFRKNASVQLHNVGQQLVSVGMTLSTCPHEWTNRSMHFHADWRSQFDVRTRPYQDWNYLTATGKGVYAGACFDISNPVPAWWGEGDEKIYFDGQEFPSHFGTGTEDYFGYAWGSNELFSHAYHNQTRADGPKNKGNTSVNRWHIIDRIPFRKDFRFDMEIWHWDTEHTIDISATTYWYARPGASSTHEPLTAEDLRLTDRQRYTSPKTRGAVEGEHMKILEKTGTVGPQGNDGCSGEQHLWWSQGAHPGDQIVLGFDVKDAGRYLITAGFLRAGDYGIVRLRINDADPSDPIDLYHPSVSPSQPVKLGTFNLAKGQNRITIEMVGANEKAEKRYMASLDYLILKRVQ